MAKNIKKTQPKKNNACPGDAIRSVRASTRKATKKSGRSKNLNGVYKTEVGGSCRCTSLRKITANCPFHDSRVKRDWNTVKKMIEKMNMVKIKESYSAKVAVKTTTSLSIPIEKIMESTETQLIRHMRVEQKDLCIFCSSSVEDDDLFYCEHVACKTQFHLKCVLEYVDAGYRFQYLSRKEVTGLLSCPLHFCHHCMEISKTRHTACSGTLVECIKCVRAWHSSCEPAGSKIVKFGDQKMLICPSHSDDKVNPAAYTGLHMDNCFECNENENKGPIIKCQYCPRTTHKKCQAEILKKCNPIEQKVDYGTCRHCARKCAVRAGRMCVYYDGGSELEFGVLQSWEDVRVRKPRNSQKLARVIVQKWSKQEKRLSTEVVILKDQNVVELTDEALKKHFEGKNDYGVLKFMKEYKKEMKPKYKREIEYIKDDVWTVPKKYMTLRNFETCYETCFTSRDREYEGEDFFCTKDCDRQAGPCPRQFEFPEKTFVKLTVDKGLGLFAKVPIEKGEFITKFSGEVITVKEYERIEKIRDEGNDEERERYAVEFFEGLLIDPTVTGDHGRYANFSHEPNAEFKLCFYPTSLNDKKEVHYLPVMMIKARNAIAHKEEITIDYGPYYVFPSKCYCDPCKRKAAQNAQNATP